ncbi:MAG TPA: zf-HC2 domain-containing protein [Actinomycetota bacterium]|jgi:anti-sigma factor RsiW
MDHPDELLAGYADGSASPEERRAVETHLAECSQCRDELDLAKTARAALMSLPELEAPGLAAQGIEALRRAEVQPAAGPAEQQPEHVPVGAGVGAGDELADRREARQRRQWQVSWAALAGVAAVLAALAIVPLVLNRGGGSKTAGGPAAGSAASPTVATNYPPVFDRSSDYDQASIQALARQLGQDARRGAFERSETLAGPPPTPSLEGSAPKAVAISASDVVRCAVRGTGLAADTVPVYLETATYQGTPAYVVAVQTEGGNRSHLRVYVVGRQDCNFLYEADQPL